MGNEITEKDAVSFNIEDVDCFDENNTLWFRLSDIAKILEVGKNAASM